MDFFDKLGDTLNTGLSRWIDVEVYRATAPNPPNLGSGGVNIPLGRDTGTNPVQVGGSQMDDMLPWAIGAGVLILAVVLLKR